MEIYTIRVQILLDVLANIFTQDVVRAVGNFGGKNTRGVGAENSGFICATCVGVDAGSVVVLIIIYEEVGIITPEFSGGYLKTKSVRSLIARIEDSYES